MTIDDAATPEKITADRSTDEDLQEALKEHVLARLSETDAGIRELADELVDSLQDVVDSGRKATIARVVHRLFERSVAEFFTSQNLSTQLPNELLGYARPHPDAVPLEDTEPPDVTLSEALAARRSVRDYAKGPLSPAELSGVLRMAAAKNGSEDGYQTKDLPLVPYPSIGGLDSNELGVVVNNVAGIESGYYRYDRVGHGLIPVLRGDMRLILQRNTFETEWIFFAPVVFVLNNNQPKVNWKYKTRGYRISHMDQGALLQNLYLAAVAHELGACAVAGFLDDELNEALRNSGTDQFVSALVAMGRPLQFGRSSLG